MVLVTITLQRGMLESVIRWMADIAANRIGGENAWHVSEAKAAFAAKQEVFVNAKNDLIKTHQEEGAEGIRPGDQNWEAFVEDYNELATGEVEVEIKPLEKSFILGLNEVSADAVGGLRHLGIIVEKASKPKEKAGK